MREYMYMYIQWLMSVSHACTSFNSLVTQSFSITEHAKLNDRCSHQQVKVVRVQMSGGGYYLENVSAR